MLNRNQFLLLLILAMTGAIFAYSLPDLVSWLKPIIIDWFRYSITATVMVVAIIVIVFGVFLVWCCAKYGQYQSYKARKLYKETNDNYEDHW